MSTLGDEELSLILNLDKRLKWQKLILSSLHAIAKSLRVKSFAYLG